MALPNQLIKRLEHPLSGPEMSIKNIPIVSSIYILNIDDIEKLFIDNRGKKCKSVIILYVSNIALDKQSGHWSCITLPDIPGRIDFFDSYGLFPDKYLYKDFGNVNYEIKNHLSNLLADSGCTIHYNEHRYQGKSRTIDGKKVQINTCGRHVLNFLYSGKDVDSYYDMMKKERAELIKIKKESGITNKKDLYTTYDDLVCILIN